MEPTQTAVSVVVAAALDALADFRQLDRAAGWGVAPHVTVAYPFAPPDGVDALTPRLAAVVATVPAFECVFARTAWFGTDVLYLVPEPDDGFRALTSAVWQAFPDWPPYGGAFADPVPHLTVGHTPLATANELQAAERTVTERLPLHVRVEHAHLLAGTDAPNSWHTLRQLPLG